MQPMHTNTHRDTSASGATGETASGTTRRAVLASGALLAASRVRSSSAAPQPAPPLAASSPPPGTVQWDYGPLHGPSHWTESFPICTTGQHQAPIDLAEPFTPYAPAKRDLVRPGYTPCPFVAKDSGTTARWEVAVKDEKTGVISALTGDAAAAAAPAGGLRVGGAVWPLIQLHFHSPGEEAVNGVRAPLGVHLVHALPVKTPLSPADLAAATLLGGTLEPPKTIVVTILFDAPPGAKPHPAVATLFSALPGLRKGSESSGAEARPSPVLPSFDPATLLPPSGRIDKPYGGAWAYAGSLTTPPCSEGVTFVVARKREVASPEQAAALGLIGGWPPNARPLQARHGRPVIII